MLGPIERLLDEIESDGTVAMVGSTPVFQPAGQSEVWSIPSTLRGIGESFAHWAKERNQDAPLGGLRQLANKLDAQMPLTEGDITRARADLGIVRRAALFIKPSEIESMVRAAQIKSELSLGATRGSQNTGRES
ncbi:hypothetical protein [Castellaniella sp.]|uniref:hypothetical protein n=1 Tax=Castellaniella sp. TaxID=1955812 RepID=UPI002AFEB862|nr:hypothetical protein [Castellaniella sp.]